MTEHPEVIEVATDGPARAVFTTRRGGVSSGPWASLNLGVNSGDRPADVRANRRALAATLGIDPARVTMVHQVHGGDVLPIDRPTHPGRYDGDLLGWHEADGLATTAPGLPVMVLGADCLPVLLWRRDRPAVAAAHAGWRGLVGGVLDAAVASLGGADRIGAAIGPGIGPCCYPVSADVRARFAALFGADVIRGEAVDLQASARAALRAAGVPASAVHVEAACTHCQDDRFFSFRRAGGPCGRQAGVIWAVDGGGAGA